MFFKCHIQTEVVVSSISISIQSSTISYNCKMEVVFQNGKKNICLITWTILKIQLDNNLYGLSYCLK